MVFLKNKNCIFLFLNDGSSCYWMCKQLLCITDYHVIESDSSGQYYNVQNTNPTSRFIFPENSLDVQAAKRLNSESEDYNTLRDFDKPQSPNEYDRTVNDKRK